jgi:uncharacterized protein
MVESTKDLGGYLCTVDSLSGHSYTYDAVENSFRRGTCGARRKEEIVERMVLPYGFADLHTALNDSLSYLILCVSEQCNLRCDYCSYNGSTEDRRSHSSKQMRGDVARRAIDWFLARSSKSTERRISFYGGEPLTNFELIRDSVAYVKSVGAASFRYLITTNGTLLDESVANWLAENPNVFVNITLNGPKDLHDRFRHAAEGEGSYDAILANIDRLKRDYRRVYEQQLGYSINYLAASDLVPIREWCEGNSTINSIFPTSLRRIVIRHMSRESRAGFSRYASGKEDVSLLEIKHQYVRDLVVRRGRRNLWGLLWDLPLAYIHNRSARRLQAVHPFSGGCAPILRRTYVGADGDIRLCEKGDGKAVLGDVSSDLQSGVLRDLLEDYLGLLNKFCRQCYCIRRCSLCLNDVLRGQTLDETAFASRCREMKTSYLAELSLYCSVMEKDEHVLDSMYVPVLRKELC